MKKTGDTTTTTTKSAQTTTMKRSVSCITTKATTTTTTTINTSTLDKNKRTKFEIPVNGILSPIDHDDATKVGLSILMVDDNPINITILRKCLNKTNKKIRIRRIESASNGIEALHLLNLHHFDLILLDIDMPILNGIDTTKCIRKKGQTIPIIAVTTNDSIESRDNYIKIGMNDCLSKPVDLELLEQTLFKVLISLPSTNNITSSDIIPPMTPTSPTT